MKKNPLHLLNVEDRAKTAFDALNKGLKTYEEGLRKFDEHLVLADKKLQRESEFLRTY